MAIILAIMVAATMGMAMTATVFAADHAVSTTSTTHTYQIYQIFTGTYDSTTTQLQNLKYGANAKTGTAGNSVSATDMAALATIEGKTYASDQLKINDLLPFVDLTGTPVAEIGKGKDASASLAEGYYIIKDTDGSLDDPETYTLYMFKVLNEDLAITPKDGTTTVDKTVTETNDTAGTTATGKKGADYDEGDSIPYSITVTLPENFSSYKTYTATLTDTLSEGLTPPAASDITVTVKSKNGQSQNISGWYNGYPKVEGQVITFSFTTQCPAGDTDLHSYTDLNGATITLTYNAVLNDKAKVGSEGNPNEYTLEYSNNPNDTSSKENTPPEKVKVYTYELTIEKVDGNNQPLQGAGFTLYKEVTQNYPDAETGAAIKTALATTNPNANASKLADAKYYVAVSMTEAVNASTGKVTPYDGYNDRRR